MSDQSLPVGPDNNRRVATNGDRLLHPDVKFEPLDIGVRGIAIVLGAIVAVFVGVSLLSWWILNLNHSEADRLAQAPQYSVPAEKPPASPRLEMLDRSESPVPAEAFAKQLALEHVLHTYGDTGEQGFVHIPIEQARKLLVDTLPVRQGAPRPPAKGFGLVGGGESNSGRMHAEGPSWLQSKR